MVRIGDQQVTLMIGRLAGFSQEVNTIGLAYGVIRQIESVKDPGNQQSGETLAVWRAFQHTTAAEIRTDRLGRKAAMA
jgi:hypothetical protein